MLKEFQNKKYGAGKDRLRQKKTCGCIESLLKLGSQEMKNEKNSNVKSNKREEGEKEKKR